jgi:hypothetical protein
MLAALRTSTRATTTPHLRWVTGHRVNFNPPLSYPPRCSSRQLSSSRVSRSSPELAFGTTGAPCVIRSSRFLGTVWLKVAKNTQAIADHRTPEKHSPSKQTTNTTRPRSTGCVPTVSRIRVRLSPRARGLIPLPGISKNGTLPSRSLLKISRTCPVGSTYGHLVCRADPTVLPPVKRNPSQDPDPRRLIW